MEEDLESQESYQAEEEFDAGSETEIDEIEEQEEEIEGVLGYEPVNVYSGGFREIMISVLTGLAIGAVFLACYFIGNIALLILITLGLGAAVVEFYAKLKKVGYDPAILLGIVVTLGLSLGVYWRGVMAYPVILVLAVFFVCIWYLLIDNEKPAVPNIAITLFGIFYIGILGSTAVLLLTVQDGHGPNLILAAVLAAVSYDVGGWLVGKSVGRIKFTKVSPNKTLEGLIAGMIFAIVIPVVLLQLLNLEPFGDAPGTFKDVLIFGIIAAIVAPVGDLVESLIKRSLSVKDMGVILPGHGGVLDRVDALLFVFPATLIVALLLDLVKF